MLLLSMSIHNQTTPKGWALVGRIINLGRLNPVKLKLGSEFFLEESSHGVVLESLIAKLAKAVKGMGRCSAMTEGLSETGKKIQAGGPAAGATANRPDKPMSDDELLEALRTIEVEAARDCHWVHYKGYNDLKVTFNNALAICEEIRTNHRFAEHGESKELPSHVKGYIYGKLDAIKKAME